MLLQNRSVLDHHQRAPLKISSPYQGKKTVTMWPTTYAEYRYTFHSDCYCVHGM